MHTSCLSWHIHHVQVILLFSFLMITHFHPASAIPAHEHAQHSPRGMVHEKNQTVLQNQNNNKTLESTAVAVAVAAASSSSSSSSPRGDNLLHNGTGSPYAVPATDDYAGARRVDDEANLMYTTSRFLGDVEMQFVM
ncbi:hypothetical protein CPC08DRAFT_268176 [Agrocybe pediades]|nr:hypothetical protein CPC08DRAFT_268176 [Agrocybe pediades]